MAVPTIITSIQMASLSAYDTISRHEQRSAKQFTTRTLSRKARTGARHGEREKETAAEVSTAANAGDL